MVEVFQTECQSPIATTALNQGFPDGNKKAGRNEPAGLFRLIYLVVMDAVELRRTR